MTGTALNQLRQVLAEERKDVPDALYRIMEVRRGRHNEAVCALRLTLDEPLENDVTVYVSGLPFAMERDFFDLFGKAPIFYIITDKRGMPLIQQIDS